MMKIKYILPVLLTALAMISCDSDDGPGDPMPVDLKMSIGNVSLPEGNAQTTFRFQVSLSSEAEQEVRVKYETMDVTAAAGEDFEAKAGTLAIPSGQRTGQIEIPIITDTLRELDEVFKVIISDPVNATIQQSEGEGLIRNDDTYVFLPGDGYITPESYTGYDLVWGDEFDGPSLNLNDWTYELFPPFTVNNELQYYTDRNKNSFLSDGALVIEAHEEAFNGANYTSARIKTEGKQEFMFGRVDIRAILPEGQGLWPALWMLGSNISSVGWPACGEIDIMELVGHEPATVHGTAHWGPQGQGWSFNTGGPYNLNQGKFSDEYHVFSIIWEFDSIRWLVDDEEFYSITDANVNGNYPFNQDFFFIFNIAVGGIWPGSPDETTVFPQRMVVDYVRMFQKN